MWAEQRAGWEGLVMLYTPQSQADLKIVFQLIVESYNFVTGREVTTDYIGPPLFQRFSTFQIGQIPIFRR